MLMRKFFAIIPYVTWWSAQVAKEMEVLCKQKCKQYCPGTDPQINQGGGWLTFQVGSFICV